MSQLRKSSRTPSQAHPRIVWRRRSRLSARGRVFCLRHDIDGKPPRTRALQSI